MQLLAIVTLHDACPAFSTRTFEITEQLEKLEVRYNIGLVPFFNGEQDLPRFPKFVKQIECCSAEIALHGLYHENKRHQIDDFSTRTKAYAEQEIRAGLQIFQQVGLYPTIFIPPCWKLNIDSITVLSKLRFRLTEMQERLVLLFKRTFRKIRVPKVLNWDSCGDPEKNITNIDINRRHFKILIQEKAEIVRIALHPRDPRIAFRDQMNMILQLKEQGYQFLTYSELVSKFSISHTSATRKINLTSF
ncbi:MAG: DUF2334 domain-containing protein [Nitrososphaeraceae archaeon]